MRAGIAACCLLVATADGCPQNAPTAPEITMSEGLAEITSSSRFLVRKEATFHDDLAYGNKRAIYTIRDTETGKEYIGVSGIGITELGSHKDGENTVVHEQ